MRKSRVTAATVTKTERAHTWDPSHRSATRLNNARVLWKQNEMDSSVEDPKELNDNNLRMIQYKFI